MSAHVSAFHVTGNSEKVYDRVINTSSTNNATVAHWSSRVFVRRGKGDKDQRPSGDIFVKNFPCRGPCNLLLSYCAERTRELKPINIFRAPLRRNVFITTKDNDIIKKNLGSEFFGSFQHVSKHECISVQTRAGVEITLEEDSPREITSWENGPHGIVWEAEDIARAVDGVAERSAFPGSISTDSRRINAGEWFLALVGPNFDGHQFLQQALDRGCVGAIGKAVSADWPRGFVRVEDTLRALHQLAGCVRRRYEGTVVGITGSTGKTTARAMTALALESLGIVHQTEGNFNNHIGLPLTLLKLPSTASACVLEMGMNHSGEISVLAEIAQPSVRVLLNIGPAHMEHFGSLDEVSAAKGELLSGAKPGDVCVLNADDPLVMNLPIPSGVRVVLFGRQDGCHVKVADAHTTRGGRALWVVLEHCNPASILVENSSCGARILESLRENLTKPNVKDDISSSTSTICCEAGHESDLPKPIIAPNASPSLVSQEDSSAMESCISPSGVHQISRVEFEIPSPGLHLALNSCAAAAVAVYLGVPLQLVGKSLSKYSPIGMRSRLEELGNGIQLINDAYNSNPMSIESGLKLLDSIACRGWRIALLGDMLELGSVSKKAHSDAVMLCKELNVDMVGLVGPSFSEAVCSVRLDEGEQIFMVCQDSQELAAEIVAMLRPGDVVLVKGSRGMKMEIVANAIRTSNS